MKKTFVIVLVIFMTTYAFSTNYYLSSKGNDQQSGTSISAPWRSLKKISESLQLLRAGDSILFDRGSIFYGELKISASGKLNNEIYVGAYGSGADPIISGSVEISKWSLFRDKIWVSDCNECSEEPGNLFIDGKFQPLGRYPNEGYMTFSCTSQCTTSLTDNHLSFENGYWDGSEVAVKSSRWTLDNLPVSNYFNKTFYFSVPASYLLPSGYGYFIQKHLATLDQPGEWFFDKTSRKIFLYCKAGDKPADHRIEVSVTDFGLKMTNAHFIRIENMKFRFQRMTGVRINYSSDFVLRNCAIEYSGNNGMEVSSCQGPTVEHCRIENSNNNGVEWSDNANGVFVRNFIQRTGLHPGRGRSGNGTYIALSTSAGNSIHGKNLFQYNSIDSTGYLGIDFRTGGTSIKNNLVSNFCMTKDDGAGIYTWGNSNGNNIIEGNIVLNGIGCGAGTKDFDQVAVSGIYIDDRSADLEINKNTVAYCGTTGIYIHNAKRITVQGNTLHENGSRLMNKEQGQLSIKLDNLVSWEGEKVLDLRIIENFFTTVHEGNHCIYLQAEKEQDLKTLGMFDRNQYCAPRTDQVIAKFYSHQDNCEALQELSLQDWQQKTGNDMSSQFRVVHNASDESVGSNFVKNSGMTNSIEGWVVWPSKVSLMHDKRRGADGPSLKVQFPSGKNEALLYYAGISLNHDKWYRLSFFARSTIKSKIEFVPMMASSPWEALGEYACFSVDTVFKSFTYLFQPNKSNKNARVNFKSDVTFWIDNVTLSEVVLKTRGEEETLRLVYNAEEKPKTISLREKFKSVDGHPIPGTLVLQGFSSLILEKNQ